MSKKQSRRAKRDATGLSLYPKQDDIPEGYVRILSGDILPSDLVWDCMGRTFINADDPTWLTPNKEAEYCIYVLRSKSDIKPQGTRTYKLR